MELHELEELSEQYGLAVFAEMQAKQAIQVAEQTQKTIESAVLYRGYVSGEIDGKNSDIRALQENALLSSDDDVLSGRENLRELADDWFATFSERERLNALVGLTRAWLYSQTHIV